MTVQNFMQETGFSKETQAVVLGYRFTPQEIDGVPHMPWLDAYYTGDCPDCVLALLVNYLARYSENKYLQRGLTRGEWLDTMRDLVIWSEHLRRNSGECGVRETHWLAHLVRTEIFRLGRLQFIPRVSKESVSFGNSFFPAGTRFCEVHIPQGGKLTKEETDVSFKRAGELFDFRYYSCDSWLLSPKLQTLLADGNIRAFASRFTVTETDEYDRSAERYIFGEIADPHTYLATNELSHRVKELALQGSFVGSALGYCFK